MFLRVLGPGWTGGGGGSESKSDGNARHTFSWLKFVAFSPIFTATSAKIILAAFRA